MAAEAMLVHRMHGYAGQCAHPGPEIGEPVGAISGSSSTPLPQRDLADHLIDSLLGAS